MPTKAPNKGNGQLRTAGPAKGPGWGGPAKGFVYNPSKKKDFDASTKGRAKGQLEGDSKRALRLAQAETVQDTLFELSQDTEQFGTTRIMAGDKFLDRVLGKAIATTQLQVSGSVREMTDAQLLEIISQEAVASE